MNLMDRVFLMDYIPANRTGILTILAVLYRRPGIYYICTGIFICDKTTDYEFKNSGVKLFHFSENHAGANCELKTISPSIYITCFPKGRFTYCVTIFPKVGFILYENFPLNRYLLNFLTHLHNTYIAFLL